MIYKVLCVVLFTMAAASRGEAQYPSTARLDLTLGSSSVRGGTIDFRSGVLADVFGAARLRPMQDGAIVAGLGMSGIMGGMGDRCLLLADGHCAGQGNFTVASALIGVDRSLGSGSLRMLAGPSLYDGANAHSVGIQGRLDLASPAVGHLAVGLMTRATLLPDHDGATLLSWGLGASLVLR